MLNSAEQEQLSKLLSGAHGSVLCAMAATESACDETEANPVGASLMGVAILLERAIDMLGSGSPDAKRNSPLIATAA